MRFVFYLVSTSLLNIQTNDLISKSNCVNINGYSVMNWDEEFHCENSPELVQNLRKYDVKDVILVFLLLTLNRFQTLF